MFDNKNGKTTILVCSTGGTIGTVVNDNGKNDVSSDAASMLLYEKYGVLAKAFPETENVVFKSIRPLETLSENMTIPKWNALIRALREVDYSEIDGLFILHGTDTLHMTAPLIARVMEDTGIPTVFVTSHRTLTDPEANGPENFLNAVRLILKLKNDNTYLSGVDNTFVIYRNMDGISYIHKALELEECVGSSESFYSAGMEEFEKSKIFSSELDDKENKSFEKKLITTPGDMKIKGEVLYIKPYVGINYDSFILDGVKAVLHDMYHSSTVNTEGEGSYSAVSLLRRCKGREIPFYVFPCNPETYRYESTARLLAEGAIPLEKGTWNSNYIDLMIKPEKN